MAAIRNVFETLAFFSAIGRPVTAYEIWRAVPPSDRPADLEHLFEILIFLEGAGKIRREGDFFAVIGLSDDITEKGELNIRGGKNPGAALCKAVHHGVVIIGSDEKGNKNSFCKFSDQSFIASSSLLSSYLESR